MDWFGGLRNKSGGLRGMGPGEDGDFGARVWEVSLQEADYFVIDLETSGFAPEKDLILSLAASFIQGDDPQPLASRYDLVTHADLNGVLPHIWRQTGLSPEILQQSGRPVADVLRDALVMAVDCAWVAHHARHEVAFIQRQVRTLWKMRLRPIVIDTALVAQGLFRLRKPPSLEWLCEALDVPVTQRHQADADVEMTASIWAKEVPLCHSLGLKTVGDVVEWSLAHGSG